VTTSVTSAAPPLPVGGAGKLAMGIFLITDAMGFGAMLIAYGVLRTRAPAWPDASQRLGLPLAAAMTLTLLTSSLTALFALGAARDGRTSAMRGWMALTAGFGLAFLLGQAGEYRHLMTGAARMGLTTDLFAATFYVVTGFHGLHVLAGVVIWAVVLARGGQRLQREGRVEVAALYWHFVDLAWAPIFTFLYLLPAR
jgi:cytochrome c oxidase subunit 3